MSAWNLKSRWGWDTAALAAYRDYVARRAASYGDRRFSCEDFALRLLCDFACERGLPVVIDGGRASDSRDDRFADRDSYFDAIAGQTGADDLRRSNNTRLCSHSLANTEPGDLLLHVDRNRGYHTQVVLRRIGRWVEVYQGNWGGSSGWELLLSTRFSGFARSDPSSPFYSGVRPQFVVYELDPTGQPRGYEGSGRPHGLADTTAMWGRIERRIWNVQSWNRER